MAGAGEASSSGDGSTGGHSGGRSTMHRGAPRTPPLVPPLRTGDIVADPALEGPAYDDGGDDSDYGSASPGSVQSVLSSYASPRRTQSGALQPSQATQSMALASSAPGASARVGGAELAAYAARRARLKRAQAVKQYVSMQTAGFARIRSFDVHPAVRSALEHAAAEAQRLVLPAGDPGMHGGLIPLSEPLLHDHQAAVARRHSYQGGVYGLRPGTPEEYTDIDSESDTMSESSEEAEDAELLGGPAQPDTWLALRQECWKLAKLAGPLSVQALANQGSFYVSQAFAGHLGRMELSAAVLGTSILNVTGFATLAGLASAMETLCGQAYGAGNFKAVGVVLQRALLICLAALVSLVPLWACMEPVLLAMGQEKELARLGARYVLLSVPAVFCTGASECLKRYLMSQGVVMPAAMASMVSTLLAPLYNWIFIHGCHLGLDGAAYANDAIFATTVILLGGYVIWYDNATESCPEDTWQGWSMQCFAGWGAYLRIALPSSIMVCMEWWIVELLIIFAGLLPDPTLSVAVTGICLNVISLVYMVSFGLSGASSTRVSNALGGGRPRAARRTALASGILTLAFTLLSAMAICALHAQIPKIFTSDPKVIAATSALAWVLALVVIGDGLNATFSGVIRGAARQTLGVMVNLGAYWIFGLPLMLGMAFLLHWGVFGFWVGMAITCAVQGGFMTLVALRLDWAAEANRARALVETQTLSDVEALASVKLDGDGL